MGAAAAGGPARENRAMAGEEEATAPQVSQVKEEFATFGVTLSDEAANQCECGGAVMGQGLGRGVEAVGAGLFLL